MIASLTGLQLRCCQQEVPLTSAQTGRYLSRDGSAAGVRNGAALRAGVCRRAVEVQIPRPVCVVVPAAAFKLKRHWENREHMAAGTDLASRAVLSTLSVWASPTGGTRINVPACADGSAISQAEIHREQEVYVTFSTSCGKLSARLKIT